MNLTTKIFLALIAGLAVGAVLPEIGGSGVALAIAEPLGNLWLQALQMTIIPLIAGLLFTGIAESVGIAGGGKVAASALLAFLVLLLFSARLVDPVRAANCSRVWPAPMQAAAAIARVGRGGGRPRGRSISVNGCCRWCRRTSSRR